ncbi:MAG: hypothetical protein M1503_13305 [Thaumarchaeota archaeon]|nr:hypothetical protein [Nitrososphaerota archaeon]
MTIQILKNRTTATRTTTIREKTPHILNTQPATTSNQNLIASPAEVNFTLTPKLRTEIRRRVLTSIRIFYDWTAKR